jgi:hypothetical protein
VDDDERYGGEGGDGFDAYCIELKRQEIADRIDEDAPGLDRKTRGSLIDSLDGKVEGEEVVTEGDEGPDGVAIELTQAEKALVLREVRWARCWRDPAPKEPPRVRLRTACRPLRSARRNRGRSLTRTRGNPSGSDDPEPEPPDRPIAHEAAL